MLKTPQIAVPWAALAIFVNEADLKLHALVGRLGTKVDEAEVSAHLGLMDLEDAWTKVQSEVETQLANLQQLELKALSAADEVRLQAHLGKAEVMTAAHEMREALQRVERRLHDVKVKSEGEASQILTRLSRVFLELSRRIDDGSRSTRKAEQGAGEKPTRLDARPVTSL